jgi:hypothetical protein
MRNTISALTAAAVIAVYVTAFAQAPASEQVSGQMPVSAQEMASPAQPPAEIPGMGEEKKTDKPAKASKSKGKAKLRGHAKKTSKKQGDR